MKTLPMGPQTSRVGLAVAPASLDDPAASYRDRAALRATLVEALVGAGLAAPAPAEPLSALVTPGSSVLIKPNWVLHTNRSGAGPECLYTPHPFTLALLELVAACRPARIVLGDSPLQGCQLDALLGDRLRDEVLAAADGVPVALTDFRCVRNEGEQLELGWRDNGRTLEQYVLYDLARDSLLEPVSRRAGQFRVTLYDPRVLARTHGPGHHEYLIAREAIEADVIFSLPKLKTHMKAGLTCALKHFVGLIGRKDYLPHHRRGGSAVGGDAYEGYDPILAAIEACTDLSNRYAGTTFYKLLFAWHRLLGKLNRLRGHAASPGGEWWGNDTCWRMSLDLQRVVHYGRLDGTLAEEPQRRIVTLADGLIAGQGQGPLAPTALDLGVVLASLNPAQLDQVAARLLGLDPRRLSIVKGAFTPTRYRLSDLPAEALELAAGEELLTLEEAAARWGRRADVPALWRGQVEWRDESPAA